MGLTGMILTKETYIIHAGCAAVALVVCYVSNRLDPLPDARPAKQTWDSVDLAVVLGVGAALLVFFYSGTFFHWSGVKGLYQAYAAWFATGHEGHGHEKPWYYWFGLIARYELPAAVGLSLCLLCQRFKNISLRYLAIYGVGTLIAYSIVSYKTPWCIISFIWPFLFMLGAAPSFAPLRLSQKTYTILAIVLGTLLGVTIGFAIWKKFPEVWPNDQVWPYVLIVTAVLLLIGLRHRPLTYVICVLTLVISFGSTIWLNYFRCTTETEPYVYVQTYNDIFKLTRPLLQLAKRNPTYYQLIGHMIRGSSYPFPWVLGDFPNVGYYEHEKLPEKLDADFLLVEQDKIQEVEGKLHESYYTDPLTIRPYQDPSKVYFNAKRFKNFFRERQPDFIGKASG